MNDFPYPAQNTLIGAKTIIRNIIDKGEDPALAVIALAESALAIRQTETDYAVDPYELKGWMQELIDLCMFAYGSVQNTNETAPNHFILAVRGREYRHRMDMNKREKTP